MKKAEDFRKAFGPADAGFRTVMQKTIEGLKAEEEKKKEAWDLRRFRMPALAAALALVVLVGVAAGGGFRGLINRPDEILPGGSLYTAQPIETTLAQGPEMNGIETAAPDENEAKYALVRRVLDLTDHWKRKRNRTDEDLDEMLKLCSSEWKEKAGDARAALDEILGNTECIGFEGESEISGNAGDPVRTVTCEKMLISVKGRAFEKYRIVFDLVLEADGLRYIDPESIRRSMSDFDDPASLTNPEDIINEGLEAQWPGITKELIPVNLSCEKQGLRFEVISAVVKRHEAYYVWSIQDLESDRINSENQNSYGFITDNFRAGASLDGIGLLYEDTEHRYTFGTKRIYDKELPSGDGTFTLGINELPVQHRILADLAPYREKYGKTEKGKELPKLLQNYSRFDRDEWQENGMVLDDTHPLEIKLDEDIFLTGIGWINGELHARIHFKDNREIFTESGLNDLRFNSFLCCGVREIATLEWDDTDDGIPDWVEYVLEISPEDADRMGGFEVELITLTEYVEDTWEVEVPLRLVREDPDNSGDTEYEKDGLKYMLHSDGTATVRANPDNRQLVKAVIPWTVNKSYRVTEIGEGTFEDCVALTSIEIPESVVFISDRAFSGCTGLTAVKIPRNQSMFSIGEAAFEGCTGLTEFRFGEQEDLRIGENAFRGCTGLTEVTLPSGTSGVGSSVFAGCVNLESVTLPLMVTGISDSMFSGCVKLETVSMPDGQRYIGKNAFEGCVSLKSMDLTDQMMVIDDEAFKGCESLDNLVIPTSTWGICDRAFQECTGMKTITVQTKKLEEIGEDVWKGCDEQKISVILDGETKPLADWYEEVRENTEQP